MGTGEKIEEINKETSAVRKKYIAKRQEDQHSHVIKGPGPSTGHCGARGHSLPDSGIQHHS
jgi:hypothetical protein